MKQFRVDVDFRVTKCICEVSEDDDDDPAASV